MVQAHNTHTQVHVYTAHHTGARVHSTCTWRPKMFRIQVLPALNGGKWQVFKWHQRDREKQQPSSAKALPQNMTIYDWTGTEGQGLSMTEQVQRDRVYQWLNRYREAGCINDWTSTEGQGVSMTAQVQRGRVYQWLNRYRGAGCINDWTGYRVYLLCSCPNPGKHFYHPQCTTYLPCWFAPVSLLNKLFSFSHLLQSVCLINYFHSLTLKLISQSAFTQGVHLQFYFILNTISITLTLNANHHFMVFVSSSSHFHFLLWAAAQWL